MAIPKLLLASLVGSALALPMAGPRALAAGAKSITLIQLGDTHGHMHEHAEIFPDGRIDTNAGGLAKLTTLINQVRADNPDAVLLGVGDTTHGSAEMLFSAGELIMPWLNSIGLDAFTPGNWDFGWGPRVYRQRFTPAAAAANNVGLAPNNRTSIAWLYNDPDPASGKNCNVSGGIKDYSQCHLIGAEFPTVAMNVYNFNEVAGKSNPAQPLGPLVHQPFITKDVNGVKMAIMGLTTDVVPQQAQAFNTGFRFTMGYKEMAQNIAAAKADGANLIVVLSELGLAKNVQMVKEFPEIDVMFSGHTHERTPQEIVIEHIDSTGRHISLVTESGEDCCLGRLDLKVNGAGTIIDYTWNLLEADSTVADDPTVHTMVASALSTFFDTYQEGDPAGTPGEPNPDFACHTFGVNAFPFGTGHTNCDSLDKWVGHTDLTIQRWNVLEDVSNNVMVDAFLDLAQSLGVSDSKGKPLTDDNSLSTTNGFRFDIVIPGSDDGFSGDITVGDLYDYYPIGAATALAEYTGGRLKAHWEGILDNVFDPNPFRQRGGWFLGFTHNMHFDIRLSDDFPRSISYGAKRIANVTVNDTKVDDSQIYTLASCYPHGNPTDEVCRTTGATNLRFISAPQEGGIGPTDIFGNRQLDMAGPFTVAPTAVTDADLPVFDPARTPLFRKVAPNGFVHPVDALKLYLPTHPVTQADHGLGRVVSLDPVPVSEYGGPGIVQPTQGAGASWLKREFVTTQGQSMQ